jgi:sialic acid synthase SpsE
MSDCALDEVVERKLQQHTKSRGMIFISTPFSRAAANRLAAMDVPAYKIGSGECNNYPLVDHIASFGRPIILSTGMNDISSVAKAVDIIRRRKVPFALLHTTNVYPTPPELVRLGGVTELQEAFPDAVVGLSDHTVTNHACFGAVALGACILERHFTDRMDRAGPDIVCSMDPKAASELIEGARLLQLERGGRKGLAQAEEVTARFAYATVVTIRPIAAGEVFSKENLWVKRPGTGEIPAEAFEEILGKHARHALNADHHLAPGDVAD